MEEPRQRRRTATSASNMGEAAKLLKAAGWTIEGRRARPMPSGEPLTVEFLLVQPDFERIVLPYVKRPEEARHQGHACASSISSQYERRIDSFDFDIIVDSFGAVALARQRAARLLGLRRRRHARAAAILIGIKNPAIDKLIDRIVFAKDRAELVAATHALDRVLLWNYYVVPQWHYPFDRIAIWDMFGRPQKLPSQSRCVQQVWWIDPTPRPRRSTRPGEVSAMMRTRANADRMRRLPCSRPPPLLASIRGGAAERRAAPRPLDLRRSEVPRRLQALRLRQSGRAQGRADVDDRHRRRAPPSTASTTSS